MEKEGKFDGLVSDVEDNDDNDEYYMRGWLKFFDFVPSDEHSYK
jgi:hypothetical protein